MFTSIAKKADNFEQKAGEIFKSHPNDLLLAIEKLWEKSEDSNSNRVKDLGCTKLVNNCRSTSNGNLIGEANDIWHHLIYAYLLEETGMVEIFKEIIKQFSYGFLGAPEEDGAQEWLRTTEALFFSYSMKYSVIDINSRLRPEPDIIRRNAYLRMFGRDLKHGQVKEWTELEKNIYNGNFTRLMNELLHELWIARIHRKTTGIDETDKPRILKLVQEIRGILNNRRLNGNLAREELYSVCMLDWFFLTISYDSPIVKSLDDNSLNSESDPRTRRLTTLVNRLTMQTKNSLSQELKYPHQKTRYLLELAEPLSVLLRLIERNEFKTIEEVEILYSELDSSNNPNELSGTVETIVTNWSEYTGVNLKDREFRKKYASNSGVPQS